MKILENIKSNRKAKKISQEEMAKHLGIELSTYGKIERGDIKLTVERMIEIAGILNIPTEILVNENVEIEMKNSDENWNTIYVPVKAQAGPLSDIETTTEQEFFNIPGVKGRGHFMIEIEGDSMYPTLSNGDYIVIRKQESQLFKWGELYVVDTRDGMAIKRVFPSEDNKFISLYSDNKFYRPYEIKIDSILSVWTVSERISKNLSPLSH